MLHVRWSTGSASAAAGLDAAFPGALRCRRYYIAARLRLLGSIGSLPRFVSVPPPANPPSSPGPFPPSAAATPPGETEAGGAGTPATGPGPTPARPAAVSEDPVRFPLGWLLDNADGALQYRSYVDVARLPAPEGWSMLPYTSRPALLLALSQSREGTWGRTMLSVPPDPAEPWRGVGTINAVRRLLESGWDRESPPLVHARRILFRLLAEDLDPAYLFEFAGDAEGDEDLVRRGRGILREAAAAALAQAGYEADPRLRGAARRILERIATHLRSPLAAKPWVRVGNKQVLAAEATPPSIHALTMLAFMPLFRSEHHDTLDRIYQYVSQPLPRQEPQQLCGQRVVVQSHLVLGDPLPHRNAADADVPAALAWLELMARLGFLRRNETWTRLFERFLDDRDGEYVWHPHKGTATPRSTDPHVWPWYPIAAPHGGDARWVDVTFRLGLIARLSGRSIDVV